jgi:hypothetical protein
MLYRTTVRIVAFSLAMPSVSLEDRIRELCAKAVETKDSDQLSPILSELRAALHEQNARARGMIAERARQTISHNEPPTRTKPR